MAQKCVHKACGKKFTDPDEDCLYHPGPPIFHEGQKGWKCCNPRVLTFDEFLSIPPCTTGKHSTVDDTPEPEPSQPPEIRENVPPLPTPKPIATNRSLSQPPVPQPSQAVPLPSSSSSTPAPEESDLDDPSLPIPPNTTCRRRGCNTASSPDTQLSRESEECIYHPGQALFHEGSKGWTCCKRRVLEFDEFMKIQGCKRKDRHVFVGRKKDPKEEEIVTDVRHDFYQTPTTVIASLFLKKIDKERAKVVFSSPTTVSLDLPTADKKRYTTEIPLFAEIDTVGSTYKVMGTKLELSLVKIGGGGSWPVLRSDEGRMSGIV